MTITPTQQQPPTDRVNDLADIAANAATWRNQYERTTLDARAMTNRELAQCIVAGAVIGSLTLRQDASRRALRDEAERRHLAIVDGERA